MATLREIRRRIVGVKATSKITQAMKMVAAAKLRRAQDAMISARPYARALDALLKDLLTSASKELAKSPLLFGRNLEGEQPRILLIIVTSDRGLAGAFNANLIRFAENYIREQYADHKKNGRLSLITVGRRGTDYFLKHGYDVIEKYVGIFSRLQFDTAEQLVNRATELFTNGEYDRVEVVYNEFKSVITQRQVAERVLPVLESSTVIEQAANRPTFDYIYEPSPADILEVLVPRHLRTQVWKTLLELQ
jgi:F-type H+-transporting ATPase subunit gamma